MLSVFYEKITEYGNPTHLFGNFEDFRILKQQIMDHECHSYMGNFLHAVK